MLRRQSMRAEIPLWSQARVGRSPRLVAARFTSRKALRSGVLWGYVFGITVASSALGYVSAYPTLASRERFALTFGSNSGLDAIAGPATAISTVAGYTVWKSLAFLSVLGAVWGLLITTRSLTGEEDGGRWELMLAGQTTKRWATAQVLIGIASGFTALFVVTSLVAVVVGRDSKVHIAAGSMVYFALCLVSSGAMFAAVGALASEIAPTRRRAAGYAGTALAVSYALRMVADSGTGLSWLRWTSPLGWVEELRPLTSPRPLAFLPIIALTFLLVGLSTRLAQGRDLGASILSDSPAAPSHTRSLSGPVGLAIRLGRGTAAAWGIAVALMALLLGFVAKQAGTSLAGTPSVEKVFRKLGVQLVGAKSYLGLSFLIVSVLIAFCAIGQVSSLRGEEAEGYLEHFLVRPLARSKWLAERVSTSLPIVVVSGVLAGLFAWIGAASEHAGISFASLIAAGLNLVPPALFIFGVGVLVFGIYPRATNIATYGVLIWSFLVELVGSLVSSNHWFFDTSIFRQIAPAPAVAVNWTTDGVLVALGIASILIGGVGFKRRDLVGP